MSELSKPVAQIYYDEHDSSVMRIGWFRSDEPKNPESLYSQEYVSALLTELEAKDEALRELAFRVSAGGYNADSVDAEVFKQKIIDGINSISAVLIKRIDELEAELATPVRLPTTSGRLGVAYTRVIPEVIEAIRAAGFTVQGDE